MTIICIYNNGSNYVTKKYMEYNEKNKIEILDNKKDNNLEIMPFQILWVLEKTKVVV